MITLDPRSAARTAAAVSSRPATTIVFDSEDMRLVVFRLEPGQSVPPHRSTSSVMLTILEGHGFVTGPLGEWACRAGDVVCYAPNELHGMRAGTSPLHLVATIAPRPGGRQAAVPVAGAG